METANNAPYAVHNAETDDYLFRCEGTEQRLVTSTSLDNPYCHTPATFSQELADALAAEMNIKESTNRWVALKTHRDCPSCGRSLSTNDMDVCYPQNRERTKWRVGCNLHDFGCGLEVEGTSYDDVLDRWNTLELYHYPSEKYVSATGRSYGSQKMLLLGALKMTEDTPESHFLAGVAQLSTNTEEPLRYVALHFLVLHAYRQHW
jgi:hypothetical protein